jgi:NhaC family Na+:H+ antiporter
VATLLYLPLEIFCYASPVLSVWYGFTGFRIEKIELTDQGLTEATA